MTGRQRQFAVYMMSNRRHGTLYVGMTSNLKVRAFEHREGLVDGFTRRYGLHRLVWFETHPSAESAITREKLMKKWNRDWKIKLIEQGNSAWADLSSSL
ncbi:MAG: GIY-YIG nuclease family protein [Planctomycetota bacterium]